MNDNDRHGYVALFLILLNILRYGLTISIVLAAVWLLTH